MVVSFTSSVLGPRERGQELGERFATEVGQTVERYRRLFGTVAVRPFDVDLWSERAWSAIGRLAPEHAEEIAGIAEGAGLRPEQVASVNARTELLVAANPTGRTECSAVVALPAGRAPVAVQTWDWYDAMSAGWLSWTIPHQDGPVVRTVTEFGMLAKIGVSDRGVGVLLTMLHHANDAEAVADGEIGHPVHLLSRAILDRAGSVEEGVALATAARTSASTSLTVVDTERATSVELFPGGPGVLAPTYDERGGVLVRTNHFVSDAGRDGCLASSIGVSTERRRGHLLDAFAGPLPGSTEEVLRAMNHHRPDVCRHPVADADPALRHRTLATVALDVTAGTLDVRTDGPCGDPAALAESA